MATKNPKISVYVPDKVKQKLEEEKDKRRSHSLSAVAVEIFEEYFGLTEPAFTPKSDAWVEQTDARLEKIDARLDAIEATVFSPALPPLEAEGVFSALGRQKKLSQKTRPVEISEQKNLLEAQSNAQETQALPTTEVTEITGISRKQLERARSQNNFPLQGNGWEVTGFAEKRTIGSKRANYWNLHRITT